MEDDCVKTFLALERAASNWESGTWLTPQRHKVVKCLLLGVGCFLLTMIVSVNIGLSEKDVAVFRFYSAVMYSVALIVLLAFAALQLLTREDTHSSNFDELLSRYSPENRDSYELLLRNAKALGRLELKSCKDFLHSERRALEALIGGPLEGQSKRQRLLSV